MRSGHFGSRGRVRGLIATLLAAIVRTFRLAFVTPAAPPATAVCIARAFRPVSRRTLFDRRQSVLGTRWTLLLLRAFLGPALGTLLATRTILFAGAFPILTRRPLTTFFVRSTSPSRCFPQ